MARRDLTRTVRTSAILAAVLSALAYVLLSPAWIITALGVALLYGMFRDTREQVIDRTIATFTEPRPRKIPEPEVEDWMDYPYREAPRAHARVEWDEVTGEVIEPAHSRELEQGEAVFKAEAATLNNGRRMIGPGR